MDIFKEPTIREIMFHLTNERSSVMCWVQKTRRKVVLGIGWDWEVGKDHSIYYIINHVESFDLYSKNTEKPSKRWQITLDILKYPCSYWVEMYFKIAEVQEKDDGSSNNRYSNDWNYYSNDWSHFRSFTSIWLTLWLVKYLSSGSVGKIKCYEAQNAIYIGMHDKQSCALLYCFYY